MRTKETESLFIPAPRLNQFHILTEVAGDSSITQAELALRCKLSVAMVNNYMKELCRDGSIEYRRKSSKNVSYHLTDAGKNEVASMRLELLHTLTGLYGEAKECIRESIRRQAKCGLKRVVVYGCGELAELVIQALESSEVAIVGVCCDDPAPTGHEWRGREIINVSKIPSVLPDAVIIAGRSRSDDPYSELDYLREMGIHRVQLDGQVAHGGLPVKQMAMDISPDLSQSPSKLSA